MVHSYHTSNREASIKFNSIFYLNLNIEHVSYTKLHRNGIYMLGKRDNINLLSHDDGHLWVYSFKHYKETGIKALT